MCSSSCTGMPLMCLSWFWHSKSNCGTLIMAGIWKIMFFTNDTGCVNLTYTERRTASWALECSRGRIASRVEIASPSTRWVFLVLDGGECRRWIVYPSALLQPSDRRRDEMRWDAVTTKSRSFCCHRRLLRLFLFLVAIAVMIVIARIVTIATNVGGEMSQDSFCSRWSRRNRVQLSSARRSMKRCRCPLVLDIPCCSGAFVLHSMRFLPPWLWTVKEGDLTCGVDLLLACRALLWLLRQNLISTK